MQRSGTNLLHFQITHPRNIYIYIQKLTGAIFIPVGSQSHKLCEPFVKEMQQQKNLSSTHALVHSHKVPFFHNCSHTDLWPPLTQFVLWHSPIHLPSHQKWEPEWVIIETISLPTTCSSLTSYWAWSKCIKFLLIYNSIHYCICSNKFVHNSHILLKLTPFVLFFSIPPKQI